MLLVTQTLRECIKCKIIQGIIFWLIKGIWWAYLPLIVPMMGPYMHKKKLAYGLWWDQIVYLTSWYEFNLRGHIHFNINYERNMCMIKWLIVIIPDAFGLLNLNKNKTNI